MAHACRCDIDRAQSRPLGHRTAERNVGGAKRTKESGAGVAPGAAGLVGRDTCDYGCRMISARRFFASRTFGPVGTARSVIPRLATVILSAGTPPEIRAVRTASARRRPSAML